MRRAIFPATFDPIHLGHCDIATRATKLFDELGPRYATRNGGYSRILKFGFRKGDNAPMALVELMDRPAEAQPVEVAGE